MDNGDRGIGGPCGGQVPAQWYAEQEANKKNDMLLRNDQAIAAAKATMAAETGGGRTSARIFIEERIMYHNRMASGLNALLRAMPQDMNYAAEDALASVFLESRSRY